MNGGGCGKIIFGTKHKSTDYWTINVRKLQVAMPRQLEKAQTKLATVEHQLETVKVEVTKTFAQEAKKLDRLSVLNALLNMDKKGDNAIGMYDDAPESKIADKPVARVSLKERLAEMKVKVAGNQVEKPGVKEKGKEETL